MLNLDGWEKILLNSKLVLCRKINMSKFATTPFPTFLHSHVQYIKCGTWPPIKCGTWPPTQRSQGSTHDDTAITHLVTLSMGTGQIGELPFLLFLLGPKKQRECKYDYLRRRVDTCPCQRIVFSLANGVMNECNGGVFCNISLDSRFAIFCEGKNLCA